VYGSKDPDPYPYVTDAEHCRISNLNSAYEKMAEIFGYLQEDGKGEKNNKILRNASPLVESKNFN
jgi:hypothetical protein